MGTEACPECGHLTKVYSDAGKRQHEEGCSLSAALQQNEHQNDGSIQEES